ncbi:MAG: hypothetical protein UGF89_06385 [Acutalibacteraceae bacterium]|nr:hypothetical protein [Acutalibacteraceae bacterium]
MKIAELEKKKKELKEALKTSSENSLSIATQLQEVNYRLDVSDTISNYFFAAKSCKTKREFKMMYLVFAKYVTTLVVNFYFVPSDEKKAEKLNSACEKFLAVLTGVSDRAENAKFETEEEFFESFKMDSLSVNLAFNEFRDHFIKIEK